MEVKRKMTTYEEVFNRSIRGFNFLKYKVSAWSVSFRPACTLAHFKMSYDYEVDLIHLKKLNYTYAAITCQGAFGSCFGRPFRDDECLVLRLEGQISTYEDIPDEILTAALSELYEIHEEKMHEKKEEA